MGGSPTRSDGVWGGGVGCPDKGWGALGWEDPVRGGGGPDEGGGCGGPMMPLGWEGVRESDEGGKGGAVR